MTTKLFRLTHGTSGYIIPAPDFEITFDGPAGVMIEFPNDRPDVDVLNWITQQRGGNWIMVIWNVTIDGVESTLPNPHINNRGFVAYLVRRG